MKGYYRFWKREKWIDNPSLASIQAVGDIMLSRNVGSKIAKHGPDFPFALIKDVLAEKGILFGNLENPISSIGTPSPFVQSNFKADPICGEGLLRANFQVLSLANNHIYDYGEDAIVDTLRLLRDKGINVVGVGRSLEEACLPVVISSSGIIMAFLAYTSAYNVTDPRKNYMAPPIKLKRINENINRVKENADICIVSLHFGYENVEYPPPLCRQQARKIIEFGADLVIGHHPHVVHGLEFYRDGFIAYSLGNFVFDNLTDNRRKSFILHATFDKKGINSVDLLPVWINDNYQPEKASEQVAESIIARVEEFSHCLQDGSSEKKFWEAAGDVFLSDQKTGFLRLINRYGLKAIWVRLKHLRLIHVKLLAAHLLNKIRKMDKRR